ncbi:hypothetical protein J4E91_009720 [Alternaria rosae]|nr:hypothetical protein J4E91_009720 [Alternaria rosae]
MASKSRLQSRPAQIVVMKERRLMRLLITDTITEIEAYIKNQQQKSLRFKVNSVGLRAERSTTSRSSSTPIRLIQPGVEDVLLGTSKEDEWLTLQEWLTRHRGIASDLEDERDDSKNESLKQAMAAYIRHRHRTDFEFWKRTINVDSCLDLLNQDISSYRKYDLTDYPLQAPSRITAVRHESEFANAPILGPELALEIDVHPRCLPLLTWMGEDLESLDPAPLTMADWWKSNGRAFRFLDLPEELRYLVYNQAIGPYICPSLSRGDSSGNQYLRLSRPKRRFTDIHRFGKASDM